MYPEQGSGEPGESQLRDRRQTRNCAIHMEGSATQTEGYDVGTVEGGIQPFHCRPIDKL